jgi:glucose-6-phosphate 1-epimerase
MPVEPIHLRGDHGQAVLHPLGATVTSWVPAGARDVLWLSPLAHFEEGKAIRGGIPVCWPWFAADPAHPRGPAHGLVRTRTWSLESHEVVDGEAVATMSVTHDDASVFAPFRLVLEVRVGRDLTLRLTHHNLGDALTSCRGALHSYLAAHAATATVHGLDGAEAFDKRRGSGRILDGPVSFDEPVDLVVASRGLAVLHDGPRRVEVHREDAPDVVLWNPGTAGTRDVPEHGEMAFVCIEAAAVHEPWWVAPRGERTLTMRLAVR